MKAKGAMAYRRITVELRKKHKINHKTVQRLMHEMGIGLIETVSSFV